MNKTKQKLDAALLSTGLTIDTEKSFSTQTSITVQSLEKNAHGEPAVCITMKINP